MKREIVEVKDWEAFKADGEFIVRVKNNRVEVISNTSCFIHLPKDSDLAEWAPVVLKEVDCDNKLKPIQTPITIGAVTHRQTKPITWIDNKCRPTKELFPHWMTAEVMLKEFVEKTTDWVIKTEQTQLFVGLGFPMVRNELTGEMVPMIESFPPEDRQTVIEVCNDLMRDYLPDLERYRLEKVTDNLIEAIRADIRSWEQEIISHGGRPVLEELKFRFGFWYLGNR